MTIPCKPRLKVTLNFFDATHSFSSQSLWMELFFNLEFPRSSHSSHLSLQAFVFRRVFHDFTGYARSSHYTHSEHLSNLQIYWWLTYHCLMTHMVIYISDYGDQTSSSAQYWWASQDVGFSMLEPDKSRVTMWECQFFSVKNCVCFIPTVLSEPTAVPCKLQMLNKL